MKVIITKSVGAVARKLNTTLTVAFHVATVRVVKKLEIGEVMLKIGDTVTHVDYPTQAGRIVGRTKTWSDTGYVFLVLWDNRSQSRHIGYALKKVTA